MVPKPPIKEVNVLRMIIYSFIPFLNIYAGWRIEKFRLLLLISVLVGASSYPLGMYGPWFFVIISYVLPVVITIFVVRKFANNYNKKIKNPDFSYE